jgi:MYXO-CTERM domain-containing protein
VQHINNFSSGEIHGGTVYWNSATNGPLIFNCGNGDHVKSYKFNGSTFGTSPFQTSSASSGGSPGGFLSISANGNANGIVWATMGTADSDHGTAPGILRAFSADNLGGAELWNSNQNSGRDNLGTFVKDANPLIANGKVYAGSYSGKVTVYGLLSGGGGTGGTSGTVFDGGAGAAGGATGAGGRTGTIGSGGAGGTAGGVGGRSGGTGGSSAIGGNTGAGGANGTGGTIAAGGTTGSGGQIGGTGGSRVAGGTTGMGGIPASGGSSVVVGEGGSGGQHVGSGTSKASGCSCRVGKTSGERHGAELLLLVVTVATLVLRRRGNRATR